MFKKIIIAIGFIFGGIIAFLLGRSSNGGGISKSNELADEIGKSIDESGKINSELKAGIDRAEGLTDDIKGNNQSAVSNVRTAKDILAGAKKRTDTAKG